MATLVNSDITVVVPVLDDDAALAGLLKLLCAWDLPVVVVDGASAAGTEALVNGRARYVAAEPSRGGQIAEGVSQVSTAWIWVLHADTRPSPDAHAWLAAVVRHNEPRWGRFDVNLPGVVVVAWLMNWRSRLTKICTGDQAMFFHASLLQNIGGFPQQPLMEDIEVSKRLKRVAPDRFAAPHARVVSSSRRWLQRGMARTVLSMWSFRLRYFFGATPAQLVREYYGDRH